MEQTRNRIVEAAVRVHETLGPASATVAAVAEAAGVTRLTVYRHFPDQESLYAACSAHWMASQAVPDPAAWAAAGGPLERARAGLSDLYRFYSDGEAMLARIFGELEHLPEAVRSQVTSMQARYRQALLAPFGPAGRRRRLQAAVGHAMSFWTWRSLCREQRLVRRDAVELMVSLLAVALDGHESRRR